MTSSSDTGESTRQPKLRSAEGLADRLLAAEIGAQKSPEDVAAAGERAYLQLRIYLAPLVGHTGFDALWARAMCLAQSKFSAGDGSIAEQTVPLSASGLLAIVHGREVAVVEHNLVIAFASFNRLLFSFIGEELGRSFIQQIWPTLLDDAEDLPGQESTK